MGIFNRMFGQKTEEQRSITVTYAPTDALGLPYGTTQPPLSQQQSLQLSTVYRCVEVISDAIASQAWHVMKWNKDNGFVHDEFHDIDYLLNTEPNPAMSRFTLMKVLIQRMLLDGAGYIEIIRKPTGDPMRLNLVTRPITTYLRPDGTIYYTVKESAESERVIESENMIAALNFSYDGITGISTLRHAAETIAVSSISEKSAKGFFSSGASASGIMSAEGKMTKERADAIKLSWSNAFSPQADGSIGGGIAVVEGGLNFQAIQVNPKDAQLLESRQFNVIEICRFFGVHPSKVFDSQNLTYSNIESFQLGFLTDTVSPLNSKIESEFNRKVLRPSFRRTTKLSLNIEELLRANLDAKANYMNKMFQSGGYTINEIRKKTGNPRYNHENADKPMIQVNMAPVDRIGEVKEKPLNKASKVVKEETEDNTNTQKQQSDVIN